MPTTTTGTPEETSGLSTQEETMTGMETHSTSNLKVEQRLNLDRSAQGMYQTPKKPLIMLRML
jgi:hypothetical protein